MNSFKEAQSGAFLSMAAHFSDKLKTGRKMPAAGWSPTLKARLGKPCGRRKDGIPTRRKFE